MSNLQKYHVSKNLFNATIEQGSITQSEDIEANNRIRTKEFIDIDSDYITLSWNSEQNTETYIMMYDANEGYVRGEGWSTSPVTKPIPSNVKKIRIIWRYTSQADILPSAVNSVMAVSGQTALPYEPYSADVWHDLAPQQYINGEFVDNANIPEKYSGGSWD